MTSRASFIMEMQYQLKFVQGKFGVGNSVLEGFTPSWTFPSPLQVTKKFKAATCSTDIIEDLYLICKKLVYRTPA